MTTTFEADPADAAEQTAPALPDPPSDPETSAHATSADVPAEVPIADAVEQAAAVGIDEDERR